MNLLLNIQNLVLEILNVGANINIKKNFLQEFIFKTNISSFFPTNGMTTIVWMVVVDLFAYYELGN